MLIEECSVIVTRLSNSQSSFPNRTFKKKMDIDNCYSYLTFCLLKYAMHRGRFRELLVRLTITNLVVT